MESVGKWVLEEAQLLIHSPLGFFSSCSGLWAGDTQKPCLATGLWASALRGAGRCFSLLEREAGGWGEGVGPFWCPGSSVPMLMTRNNTHGHPSPGRFLE